MRTTLFFLFLVFSTSLLLGQQNSDKRTVIIHGMVKELNTMTPITEASISVLRDAKIIKTVQADDKGNYVLSMDVLEGEQLIIKGSAKHHSDSKNLLIVESTGPEDYLVDIELVYQTVSQTPPRILFERNDIEHIPFDLTMYRQLLEDNPKICLEIELYSHPEEKEKLTKKRLIQFEKFLIEQNFPMNQVDFNFTHHIRRCDENEPCLTELFFEISSLDGHCLQE
ncbi:MAG: hypothetical protein NXI10_13595 [bacterium]|nr:hypothetical protein [bacterium]